MKISNELRQELAQLKAEAKDLAIKDGVKALEINAKADEIDVIEAKIRIQDKVEAEELAEIENKIKNLGDKGDAKVEDKNLGLIVAKAIKGTATVDEMTEITNMVVEGDRTKGGVVITPNIATKIIEYQDSTRNFDIRPYLNVEPVGTLKGSRPIADNIPQASGFASLDEGTEIQALYEPTFTDMSYQVRKYAGFIPLTNELLEDSAENILGFITRWLGENELNTYAYQVFNGTGTKSAQGIMTEANSTGLLKDSFETIESAPAIKKFKTIFNVDLESISNANLAIYTNADGYDYLDGLADSTGRFYLQPDATVKSGFTFLGREIVKVPKKFLANVTTGTGASLVTKVPFIIGSLKDLYTMFDRKQMSIESSNLAGNAWKTDTTEVKGIFRFDGKFLNTKAVKVLTAKLA